MKTDGAAGNGLTAAAAAGGLLATLTAAPLVWWSLWLMGAMLPGGPWRLLPFGTPGGVFFAAAAFLMPCLAWRLATTSLSGRRPSPVLDRQDAAAAAAALLFCLFLWEKAVFRGWTPVNGLFMYVFHPMAALVGEILQNGRLPLWNPWANAGMPLMADPLAAAFSVFHLPLHLLPVPSGWRLWLPLTSLTAFSFTYLWLRDRDCSPAGAWLGAASLCGGGYAVLRAGYPPHLETFLWVPAVLHALDRRSFPALALALFHQVLAGHYQFVFMSLLGMGLLLAADRAPRREWLRAAAAGGAAALLASFQLLPSLSLIRDSVRSGSLPFERAATYSLSWGQAAKMLFLPAWNRFLPRVEGDPSVVFFYAGSAAVLLGIFAAARIRSGSTRTGLLLAAAGTLLALGRHTPVYRGLYHLLPGLALFRFPGQWMGLTALGVALLAAQGADLFSGRRRWLPAAALAAELLFFHAKPAYLWVQPLFLSDPPVVLADLRAAGGRVMETPRVEAWRYGGASPEDRADDFAPWLAVKDALMISQGIPYHVPEAKSITNHVPRRIAALHAQADRGGAEGLDALRKLGVTRLLDVEDPRSALPVFRYLAVEDPLPSPRAGDGAPVGALEAVPGGQGAVLRLNKPWSGGGPVVLSQGHAPGWSAWSGGQRRAVSLEEQAFLGVQPAGGDEVLSLRYDAPAFVAGAILSLATALGLIYFLSAGASRAERGFRSSLLAILGAGFAAMGLYNLWMGAPYADLFAPSRGAFVGALPFARFALAEVAAGLLTVFSARAVWKA